MIVRDLDDPPKFYGTAYRRADLMASVMYPIPLHWVVGLAKRLWWRLRSPLGWSKWESILAAARREGIDQGRAITERDAWERGFDKGYAIHGTVLQKILDREFDEENARKWVAQQRRWDHERME